MQIKKPIVLAITFLMIAAMIIPAAMAAEITTAKLYYYYPDDQSVDIVGTGFLGDAQVSITINILEAGLTYTDTVTSAIDGSFVYTFPLDGTLLTYEVVATDGVNEATTTFYDAIGLNLYGTDGATQYANTINPNPEDLGSVPKYTDLDVTIYLQKTGSAGNVHWEIVYGTWEDSGDLDSITTLNPSSGYISVTGGTGTQDIDLDIVTDTLEVGTTYQGELIVQSIGTPAATSGYYFFEFTVSEPETTTATVTFYATGISTDFTGTVITIDGTNYGAADALAGIPIEKDVGDTIDFAYASPLEVTANTKQYVWKDTIGLSTDQSDDDYLVPSEDGSITGEYGTQYYLTVNTDPAGLTTISGSGYYDENTYADTGTAPAGPIIGPGGYQYFFLTWQVDGDDLTGNPISVYMDGPHTATAVYITPQMLVFEDTETVGPRYTATYTITANVDLWDVKVQGGVGQKATSIDIVLDGKTVRTGYTIAKGGSITWTNYADATSFPSGVSLTLDTSKNQNVFTLSIDDLAAKDSHTLEITFGWSAKNAPVGQSITGPWSAVCNSQFGTLKTPYTDMLVATS
jgi:hypothetical protein